MNYCYTFLHKWPECFTWRAILVALPIFCFCFVSDFLETGNILVIKIM